MRNRGARIAGAAILLAPTLAVLQLVGQAPAQIVVPDVKKWTQQECRWMHRQVLGACRELEDCMKQDDMSMSTQRGLSALGNVLTVRNMENFRGICANVCASRSIPTYETFKAQFCDTVKSR